MTKTFKRNFDAALFGFAAVMVAAMIESWCGTSAQTPTQGAATSGTATAGAPVKTGAVYNVPQPTVTNGQVVDSQSTQYGAHIVATGADPFNVVVTNLAPSFLPVRPTPFTPGKVALTGTFGRTISSTGDAIDVNQRYADPCSGAAKSSVSISQTANTRLLVGPARRIFICSVMLVGADAENVALVEGTGTTCATGVVGVIGGTTAATGPNLAANGGFAVGGGAGAIAIGDGVDLCLLQSGAGRVAGVLTYALAN